MKTKTKNKVMMAMMLSSMGMAGYMYMKKNPNTINSMKKLAKDMSDMANNKIEEIS